MSRFYGSLCMKNCHKLPSFTHARTIPWNNVHAKCRLKTRNQASSPHIFTHTTVLNTTRTVKTTN